MATDKTCELIKPLRDNLTFVGNTTARIDLAGGVYAYVKYNGEVWITTLFSTDLKVPGRFDGESKHHDYMWEALDFISDTFCARHAV